MIAIYQRTPAGVERTDATTTVAEALDRLRDIRGPAVAFDGTLTVGASGLTSQADVDAIVRAVSRVDADPESVSCAWPGCCEPTARVQINTPAGLVDLCSGHRRIVSDRKGRVSVDSPRAVLAFVRLVGPMHCASRACAPCRNLVLAAARTLAERAS